MPPGGDSLQHESLTRETVDVLALAEFLGGEAVAVCGEGAFDVGGGEPGRGEEAGFYFGELGVGAFRDAVWRSVGCGGGMEGRMRGGRTRGLCGFGGFRQNPRGELGLREAG